MSGDTYTYVDFQFKQVKTNTQPEEESTERKDFRTIRLKLSLMGQFTQFPLHGYVLYKNSMFCRSRILE